MKFMERLNNIYLIDTRMFGFDKYMSAYIVVGKEIALVDTGFPAQLETVRAGIKAHGFSPGDISYIFITHSHPDHSGNVAPLLRDNPRAMVYTHPLGVAQMVDPSIELAMRKKALPPEMHARIGDMEAVPPDRIQKLKEGDTFDLGNGERLKVIFAPGHQPDGIVLYEEKNRGLFINDLVGNCFLDADAHYVLNPPDSDHRDSIKSLQKVMDLPVQYLYLGHYGISDKPQQVMKRSIDKMQYLLDIGRKYLKEGKPEKIAPEVYGVIMPELEKLRAARGEALFEYASKDHIATQAESFARFCRENLNR
jgi:glyoxylase-like metal-dependent hydrolase (beta-lactamase superfamily II)